MPVINFEIPDYFTRIVTWKLTETNEALIKVLNLSKDKLEIYNSLSQKRKREFLGIKACLTALGLDDNILYKKSGKPYIDGKENISISHSHGVIVLGASSFEIGVDIELIRNEKILNIKDKFIRKDELDYIIKNENQIAYYNIIWSIKESMYKIHKGNLWSFINHYKVHEFDAKSQKEILCSIIEQNKTINYKAYFKKLDNYYLTYVLNY